MGFHMDIRILKYFLAVAREENITRAAESLHIAQPSLSKQMMELEAELGKPLLIRGKRKITLTEEGMLLRKRAEDIVALLEKTEQEISADSAEITGEIAIGGAVPPLLLQAAADLRTRYPGIQFQFYVGDATDVTERLDHGNLDFAILLAPADAEKYETLTLPVHSAWGVLMPQDAPFATQNVITREVLLQMPLILHRRPGLQQMIADWAQIPPDRLQITATYNIVYGSPIPFVISGLGCFLLTDNQLPSTPDDRVVFRPLEPRLEVGYQLVWKRRTILSRAAGLYLKEVREALN